MHSELLRTFDPSPIWMDGWPAIETDAGRAMMKTPATKTKASFKVVLPTPVATTLSVTRNVVHHLATKYSKLSACPERSYLYYTDIRQPL